MYSTGGRKMSDDVQKCSIVMMSGDMDKVMGGLIIATSAAAMGMETKIFFTFWGLKAIQKGNLTGKGFFEKMLGVMNRGGIDRIGPSRFNFGGIGRWLFKKMMRDQDVVSLPELLQTAIDLGIQLQPCQMSMDVMGITMDDLIDEASEPVGGAAYVLDAQQADIDIFI
jgi:peroxiredoxin family protein